MIEGSVRASSDIVPLITVIGLLQHKSRDDTASSSELYLGNS